MNISALSLPLLCDVSLLHHAMPHHAERAQCYCSSTNYYHPYPPRGFDTLCQGKALGHPTAGSRVGSTKQ